MNINRNKLLAVLLSATLIITMACMFSGCGSKGSTEDTVEITSPSTESGEASQEDENISPYETIYNNYSAKMKAAKDRDELDKLFEDGKKKMSDAMLASTKDDEDIYTEWFKKLNSDYTDVARSLQ